MKKTVLVTGASGFLGREVVSQLAQRDQYEVVAAISGRREVSFPDGVAVKKADLLQTGACERLIEQVRPQLLVHLAWDVSQENTKAAESNMLWLEVSTRLLRSFAAHGGECILFAGSCLEYDDRNGKAQEQAKKQLMSMYGECKRSFADVMKNYCTRIGMRYIDARVFTLYGKNNPHWYMAIPQAISGLLQDKPVVCHSPYTVRDYIHVEDAARAIAMTLDSDHCGTVNIASGRPVMMKDVFSMVARILGKEKLLSFENEDRCDLILVADVGVLRERIGFYPAHDFEQDMAETIRWWKSQIIPDGGVLCSRTEPPAAARHDRKRVMVTGASGLIGHALVRELSRHSEYEVVAVSSGRRQVQFPDGVWTEAADLLDEDARAELMRRVQPDVMIHYAWCLDDNGFVASEGNIKWLEASMRLMELFWRSGGKRIIFAGTSSEYGDGRKGNFEAPWTQTYTLYGTCKLAFDRIGTIFCREHGMEFVTARYFSVYGPEDDRPGRALPTVIQTLLRGEKFVCRQPWNVWDYIYIDDAVEATVRLLESAYQGTINIASGRPAMMKDAFALAADIIGRPELLAYDETCVNSNVLIANVSNMASALDYTCPTSLREGLEKTIAWWKERTAAPG